jgi:hypothetical protein
MNRDLIPALYILALVVLVLTAITIDRWGLRRLHARAERNYRAFQEVVHGLALAIDDPTEDERPACTTEEYGEYPLVVDPKPTLREERLLDGAWCHVCNGPTEPGQVECERCWDAAEQEYARRVDR